MVSRFKSLFKPPVLADPEKNAQARNIHTLLVATLLLTFLFLIYALFYPLTAQPAGQAIVAAVAVLLEFGLLILIQKGKVRLVSIVFTTFLWIAIMTEVALYGGIRDTGYAAATLVILVASLTMGIRAGGIFALLNLLAGGVLVYLETAGKLPPYTQVSLPEILLSYSITFLGIALLISLALRNLTALAQQALADNQKQKEINALLEANQAELQAHATILEQRGSTLRMVTEVAKLANEAKTENELLERVTQSLVEQLKLDYVGAFLLDSSEERATLRAFHHSRATASVQPVSQLRVVKSEIGFAFLESDTLHYPVGTQTYYVEPPAPLSDDVVNLSLPLIAGQRLLGLLNIQVLLPHAQVVEQPTLQTLADQVALSIENIRLVKQLEERLKEIDILAGQAVQSSWEQLRHGKPIGFAYDQLKVLPAGEVFPPEVASQLTAGKTVAYLVPDDPPRSRLVTPILLRETAIGVIGYDHSDPNHDWQEEERTLLESIASRVSLALENTRLVAEAQQRADREQTLSQAAARIRETLDIDTILKTAAMELRRSLQLREAEIRLRLTDQAPKTEGQKEP